MNKQTRTYEEIITLQDKAIEALTQANAALLLALEALKKARAEHGFTLQLPGLGLGLGQAGSAGSGYVNPTFIPTVPNNGNGGTAIPMWSGQPLQTTGLMTVTNTAGSLMAAKTVTANAMIQMAQSQKELANAYVAGFQAWQKGQESNGVGGCVSVSSSSNE